MRRLMAFIVLYMVSTTAFFHVGLHAEQEKPIPFWERPDYVLESPDVIEIKVVGDTIPVEELTGINGTHLIGPDGQIGLVVKQGKMERLRVQDLTIVQCENTVVEWLSEKFGSDSIKVRVKVFSCNSKEFHVVYVSEHVGEQRLSFPFTGHETVTKALECCGGLAPGSSSKFFLLRAAKAGKPIEMTAVDYDEALRDPKKDLALKFGDTLLIRQDFKGEDLRPDGPIVGLSEPFDAGSEDMLVSEDDYEIPSFELVEAETKTASQVVATGQGGRRIARTVFFDGDKFGMEENLLYLSPLMKNIEPASSVSCMLQAGKNGGVWLILYGEEETVTELHAVFKEIATGLTVGVPKP